MKRVYRLGLGHRYGRAMQTIAGIHYNFSVPDELWLALQQQQQNTQSLQDFKSAGYFHLIRNFRRYAWLLLYLLGSAPAVCRSFVANRDHQIKPCRQRQSQSASALCNLIAHGRPRLSKPGSK